MATEPHPVGASWSFVSPAGSAGRVWLDQRFENGREMWRWSFHFDDGSGWDGDWTPSRRLAVEECRTCFAGECPVRFRRDPVPPAAG
jgi:hypothetical protein